MDAVVESFPVSEETEQSKISRLTRIDYNKKDRRSEEERAAGFPWLSNEGFVSVELDTQSLIDLLKSEGLTSEQISNLHLNFAAARVVDVDAGGSYIGGLHRQTEIVVFTTIPFMVHQEPERPPLTENRLQSYHSAFPSEFILNSLLHELRHYIQYCQGVEMPNSWAAESQSAHDQFPTEQEAIEFADKHIYEFQGKLQVVEEGGHFKHITEVIPNIEGMYFSTLVNEKMVASFIEDRTEDTLAQNFIRRFQDTMRKPEVKIDHAQLAEFINKGKELVNSGALSYYEFGYMMDGLLTKT